MGTNDEAAVASRGAVDAKPDDLQPEFTPGRRCPSSLSVARVVCSVCDERWPQHPNLPNGQATACPCCHAVAVHEKEPPNERWWNWLNGRGVR